MDITFNGAAKPFHSSGVKIANLIMIDVFFNGVKIPCVFDTGASVTVLKESAAIKAMAVSTDEEISGSGNSAQVTKGRMANIQTIKFENITIGNHKIAIVPDKAFDFGEISISAFLGWDIIKNFKWSYNAEDNSFLTEIPLDNSAKTSMLEWDNMPIIYGNCFGEKRLFGLDTGHTESILGDVLYPFAEKNKETTDLFVGIGGSKEEKVRLVQRLEIEMGDKSITVFDIPAVDRKVFPSGNDSICGLLGMDILHNKSWILDYPNRNFRILD